MYGIDYLVGTEQQLQEGVSFISALDSLEAVDNDASAVAHADSTSYGIANSISETSIEAPLTDQERSAQARQQLREALMKEEPVATSVNHAPNGIHVPEGKLAGGYGICRICGTVFNQITNYCPECGTKVVIEKPAVSLDKVQFSAVAPKTFVKGDYSVIEILMYEEAFRHVVQEAISNADNPVKETKSGLLTAEREAKITVMISSPDLEIGDNTESQIWQGGYLNFSFAVEVPEQYGKRQILFVACVYINDIIATRLKFVAKCTSPIEQKIEMSREDILSAFVSYASQDRSRVAMIIQGMKKARPDMDIFFDVDSLRSGDDWEKVLWREIDKRDVLFLCWSKYARESKWVDAEWRYALKNKGADSIEPVPIDPPGSCPPPDELSRKHFNDKLLYIINSNPSLEGDELKADYKEQALRLEDLF